MRLFCALLPLQVLDMAKHTICLTSSLNVSAGRGHRTLFHRKVFVHAAATSTVHAALPHQSAAAPTAAETKANMGANREPGGSQQDKIAMFLPNDGNWVGYQDTFARCRSDEEDGIHDNSILDFGELSLTQLRREATERGQRSSGSKEELINRLISKQPPCEAKLLHHPHPTVPALDNVLAMIVLYQIHHHI